MKNGFMIKVWKPGDKRARLLGTGGSTTRLRVHAIWFTERAKAEMIAEDIVTMNPGVRAEVAEMEQEALKRYGEPAPEVPVMGDEDEINPFESAKDQPGFAELRDTLARLSRCGFLSLHPNIGYERLATLVYDEVYGRGFKLEARGGDHSVYLARLAKEGEPR